MYYNTCTLFMLICAYGSCLSQHDYYYELMKRCVKQYPLKQDIMQFTFKGQLQDETDHNAKCFLYCFASKTAAVYKNGTMSFHYAKLRFIRSYPDFITNPELDNIVRNCTSASEAETDKCERTYTILKCLTLSGKTEDDEDEDEDEYEDEDKDEGEK